MTKPLWTLRGLLVVLTALPWIAHATQSLIVVEDRGGASALPYYEALNLQPRANSALRPPIPMPQIPATPADEAAMLPVRSAKLTPDGERVVGDAHGCGQVKRIHKEETEQEVTARTNRRAT